MALDPLQCPACSAPVPLVAGDHGTCPSCGATYPIPDTYQALRDEAAANARKPEALALAKALGTPPPAIIRAFAVFSSTTFVVIGLGFWVFLGMLASSLATPFIGKHVFHVNTYDVLTEARKMQLLMVVPFGALVIGFTLSAWARRRGIVRGGLQSALAARPPERANGPKTCHRCSAPLAPEPGALTARCAYCQADNLIEMPPTWVAAMRTQAKTLVTETEAAEIAWHRERRALRRSMITRFVLWTVLMVLPLWFIFGAVKDTAEQFEDISYAHPEKPPTDLPAWHTQVDARNLDFRCSEPTDGFRQTPTCDRSGCGIYQLVALRHGDVVRHRADVPHGSTAELQMHVQGTLDDKWQTIDSAPVSTGHDAMTRVPYSGWYRLHIVVPDDTPFQYCATTRR
ncbi:MAG TPA: hypothetical protein VGC41_13140 [Kofleriaceae bacterium]